MKGKFLMTDGLDGIGKGEIIKSIIEFEKSRNIKIFDLNEFWGNDLNKPPIHDYNPRLEDFNDYNLLVSSEPTFAGIGRRIRYEYIKNNGRSYDPHVIANAYALDRFELYTTTIIPARKKSINIIQSRGVITSLVYQLLDTKDRSSHGASLDELMNLPGNKLALNLENIPSLLIIPTVSNFEELSKRLELRSKKDDAIYENVNFQKRLKDYYESSSLKKLFENKGTIVKYIDAGVSVESTWQQAVDLWKEHIGL